MKNKISPPQQHQVVVVEIRTEDQKGKKAFCRKRNQNHVLTTEQREGYPLSVVFPFIASRLSLQQEIKVIFLNFPIKSTALEYFQ